MSFKSIKAIFDAGSTIYECIVKPLYEMATREDTSDKNRGPDPEELKRRSNIINSAGIQLMQQKNYFGARLKFEEALNIYPSNENAKRSIYLVDEKIRKQKILKTTMLSVAISAAIIIILWAVLAH